MVLREKGATRKLIHNYVASKDMKPLHTSDFLSILTEQAIAMEPCEVRT
jgi:hypothetical protein